MYKYTTSSPNKKFEYVPPSEYKPVRAQLDAIIRDAQQYLRKKYRITFQPQLIGSGNKHLITREIGGNRGFDFDYNLVIKNLSEDCKYTVKEINDVFIESFRYAVKNTKFKDPEDSTSVITIKVVDVNRSAIVHSCDLAVVRYDENGRMYCRHHNKNNGSYDFRIRRFADSYEYDLDRIERRYGNRWWGCIRDEYLKVKNSNRDPDKKSFALYMESVHNVANTINDRMDDDNCE